MVADPLFRRRRGEKLAGQGLTGIRRVVSATFNSFAGLRAAWRNEAAFRQECALTAVLVPTAFWVGETVVEYVLLLGSVLLVLIVELLNSAVEATVDRIGKEHHTLSGQAKDLGSAAVFLSLVLTTVTWGLIAWSNFSD
jgi:diacylglycerol kinase (ATP)